MFLKYNILAGTITPIDNIDIIYILIIYYLGMDFMDSDTIFIIVCGLDGSLRCRSTWEKKYKDNKADIREKKARILNVWDDTCKVTASKGRNVQKINYITRQMKEKWI